MLPEVINILLEPKMLEVVPLILIIINIDRELQPEEGIDSAIHNLLVVIVRVEGRDTTKNASTIKFDAVSVFPAFGLHGNN